MFADLHCHPHSRSFSWLRDSRYERKKKHKDKFNPWTVVVSNFKKQELGKRAFTYSQCDPVKLWNGEVKLVFASLYPFEKGFFMGTKNYDGNILKKALNKFGEVTPTELFGGNAGKILAGVDQKLARGKTSFKDLFQSILMKMPIRRINYIQSSAYDYYRELEKEYRFLTSKSGQKSNAEIFIPRFKDIFMSKKKQAKKHPDSLIATGTYKVAKNKDQVKQIIGRGNIAMVLTIEGMHAFGTDTHPHKVLERIDAWKKKEYPVFFVTFAHHFNNNLCGHAHSIIKSASLLTDQKAGMNSGFTDLGREAARRLLSLDENNQFQPRKYGRRILLDLKHTSASSRKQYYEEIVKPCMGKGDVIPVIASHVAYSGVKTLVQMEANYKKETDKFEIKGFNAWNINVCDQDIEMIVTTRGLMGLCFDQRILGQSKKENISSIDLIWNTIKATLDVVINSKNIPDQQKGRVWDILCLGTDFEGYIDPTDDYPTALEFRDFKKDLKTKIEAQLVAKNLSDKYRIKGSVSSLVNKICYKNAYDFVQRNF